MTTGTTIESERLTALDCEEDEPAVVLLPAGGTLVVAFDDETLDEPPCDDETAELAELLTEVEVLEPETGATVAHAVSFQA